MPEAILTIEDISAHYEGRILLDGIGFSLLEGEILCLLGPSGSGKTTLLRIIAGLETSSSGRIYFQGNDLHNTPPHLRNFGMMFQEYALFPHKNVWENVAFGLEMQKMSTALIQQRVREMLELVGLDKYAQHRIDELSGGERQRVALARSLAPKPKLLLLDEPLGSLDRALRDRLAGDIREILKQLSVTAIFVTHDQAEAFGVADRVAILADAALQQFARPEKIYRTPVNPKVASFLGFKNLLPGSMTTPDLVTCPLGTFPIQGVLFSEPRLPNNLTVLILPEGASLLPPQGTPLVVTGKIAARTFLGPYYRLVVETAGHQLTFDIASTPRPPDVGQDIQLYISPDSIILLP